MDTPSKSAMSVPCCPVLSAPVAVPISSALAASRFSLSHARSGDGPLGGQAWETAAWPPHIVGDPGSRCRIVSQVIRHFLGRVE